MSGRRAAKVAFSYLVAAAIIVWAARGVPLAEIDRHLEQARLSLFVPVTVGAFLCWFLGETLLYSRLFSFFHRRVTWREMLPMTTAFYFLQVVNGALAGAAFAGLIQKRKGVPWLESGLTMLFLGLLDFQVMALLVLAAALFGRDSPLSFTWRYAAAALALCWATAAFWLAGPPRARLARRLYDWEPMSAFRRASLAHYLSLAGIRAPIFLAQGLALYLDMRAFGLRVPPSYVFALTPPILLLTALPITPIGIGTEQAAVVLGFQAYGARATLLAMSLSMSGMGLLLRLALAPVAAAKTATLLPDDLPA